MSKHGSKPVDMSLPPEQRRRPRKNRIVVTPPAQMNHARSPRGQQQARRGHQWLDIETRLREDAARLTAEVAELDEDGFIARTLALIQDEDDVSPARRHGLHGEDT
jgi:hypothetical protein